MSAADHDWSRPGAFGQRCCSRCGAYQGAAHPPACPAADLTIIAGSAYRKENWMQEHDWERFCRHMRERHGVGG